MVAFSEITDAAVFLERVGGLVADEARNNLIVSIAGTIVRAPDVFPDRSMYVVERSGEPVAASLMTAPYNMILTDALDAEAAALLAEHVFDRGVAIPGVTGNRPTVDAFVEAWEARSGTVPELSMRQGVFSLEAVGTSPGFRVWRDRAFLRIAVSSWSGNSSSPRRRFPTRSTTPMR